MYQDEEDFSQKKSFKKGSLKPAIPAPFEKDEEILEKGESEPEVDNATKIETLKEMTFAEPLKTIGLKNDLLLTCSNEVRDYLMNPKNAAYNTVEEFMVLKNTSNDYGYEKYATLCRYCQLTIASHDITKLKPLAIEFVGKLLEDLVKHDIIGKSLAEPSMLDLSSIDTLTGGSINRESGIETSHTALLQALSKQVPYEPKVTEERFRKHRVLVFIFFHPKREWCMTDDYNVIGKKLNSFLEIHNHPFRISEEGQLAEKEILVF